MIESAHDSNAPFADVIEHPPQDADDAGLNTATANTTRTANTTNTANHADTTGAADAANDTDPTNAADNTDPANADAIDANLLEQLANNNLTTTNPEQVHHVEVQSLAPPVGPQLQPSSPTSPGQFDANSSDAPPQLVIDHFPHGRPGAPIPGARQGSSPYHSSQEAFGPSIWAPFCSRCDWEIAYWAKTCGPTSSAVGELLAIPEVHTHKLSAIVSLTHC